ncbi:MAG: electron transport complex subunit RsxB [Paludibacterium sp.]|uniref:electron transport complex subunit RsxB n=1 Tax=Paludibacterium sp. TaxID=1917523 RepID=UPI0025FFA32A|nr:electron transport complex subunit RsxB [Paludibacterium sp.]MBV8049515.1 electron transport complex subunit RsxB [Paludibacterium sp.]MBV8646224.1 electron transport complex subunit RsxB [Paludibacterium sp.]
MSQPVKPPISADDIDAILPQTQCRQCRFDGCRPYAEAIARGEADINRCPPGGLDGIRRLATLTGQAFRIFEADAPQPKPRELALIDEENCIGCTLCIQACPVDAILGAAKSMHTVLGDECTGCALCVAPCPVDAIRMEPVTPAVEGLSAERSALARRRYQFRLARLQREREEKAARLAARSAAPAPATAPTAAPQSSAANMLDEQKKAVIAAAMRRAAELQAARKTGDKT